MSIHDFVECDLYKPGHFDIVWASPPCEVFSAARRSNIGRTVNGEVMTTSTLLRDIEEIGVPILRKTQMCIMYLQPQFWFIENPFTGAMKNYIDSKPYVYDYCMCRPSSVRSLSSVATHQRAIDRTIKSAERRRAPLQHVVPVPREVAHRASTDRRAPVSVRGFSVCSSP